MEEVFQKTAELKLNVYNSKKGIITITNMN